MGADSAFIEAVDLQACRSGVLLDSMPDHKFMHGFVLQGGATPVERPEQISFFIICGDRRGSHPGLNPFQGLRMERRPDPPISLFMEKHVVNTCFMQQVTNFNIADGGSAVASVEKHGKHRAIALAEHGVCRGSVEEPATLLARKTWCAAVEG